MGISLKTRKNAACGILAPSAVAFMQHIPFARVRILTECFLYHRKAISYDIKNRDLTATVKRQLYQNLKSESTNRGLHTVFIYDSLCHYEHTVLPRFLLDL